MGRRGPKPKGAYADKSAVLSTRISKELREHIERLRKPGDTLSHTIEHRLRRTMNEDEVIAAAFGSEDNYAVMRTIALAMEHHTRRRPKANWLDDPDLFRKLRTSLLVILETFAPAGVEDHPAVDVVADRAAVETALVTVGHIADLDPVLPLGKLASQDNAAARIRVSLGDRLHRHYRARKATSRGAKK